MFPGADGGAGASSGDPFAEIRGNSTEVSASKHASTRTGIAKKSSIARHALSSVMSCTLTFPAVDPAPISVYWCARLKIACSNEQGSLFGGATWAICCAGEGRSTEFGISF